MAKYIFGNNFFRQKVNASYLNDLSKSIKPDVYTLRYIFGNHLIPQQVNTSFLNDLSKVLKPDIYIWIRE